MSVHGLADAVAGFEQDGYAVLDGLCSPEQVGELRRLRAQLAAESRAGTGDGSESALVERGLIERAPEAIWPLVRDDRLLDFMEAVMGPFVQLDSSVLITLPALPSGSGVRVVEWHRDRLGRYPRADGYQPPLVVVTLVYLDDLSAVLGPLRVLAGTHARAVGVPADQQHESHPHERLVYPRAGDLVAIHHNLIHSGSRGELDRAFLGLAFSATFVRPDDCLDGPACDRLRRTARERGDRRGLRLLGADDLLASRLNSGFLEPDEHAWARWREDERVAGEPPRRGWLL